MELNKKNNPLSILLGAVVGVVVAILAFNLVGSLIGDYKTSESKLNKEVSKFNENLPIKVDEITWLDSVRLDSSAKELTYFYRVDNQHILWEQFDKNLMGRNLLNLVKTEKSLTPFRERSFTWRYLYNNYYGDDLIYEYTVTPDMYQKE